MGGPVRPLLASLLLLAACAHAPSAPGPEASSPPPASPAEPAPPTTPAPGAPAPDRFTPVRDVAESLLEAQGEAAWRGWTSGEPADPAAIWKGREALLDPAVLVQLAEAIEAAPTPRARPAGAAPGLPAGRTAGPRRRRADAGARRRPLRGHLRLGEADRPAPQLHALLAGEPEAPRRKAAAEAWQPPSSSSRSGSRRATPPCSAPAQERGFGTSLALAGALRLEDPERLAALAEATLAAGDSDLAGRARRAWPAASSPRPRPRLRECDLPRLFRSTAAPGGFPADRLLADLGALLADLGLDLSAGGRLTVDATARPGKVPRPLAVPVEVPGAIRLSLTPLAGLDAYRASLHELGLALSQAHVAPAAPFEDRRLPAAWKTQAWGFLFEEMAASPDWLRARGVSPEAAAARGRPGRRPPDPRHPRRGGHRADRAGPGSRPVHRSGPLGRAGPARARPSRRSARAAPWRLEPDPLLRAADTLRAHLLARQLSASCSRRKTERWGTACCKAVLQLVPSLRHRSCWASCIGSILAKRYVPHTSRSVVVWPSLLLVQNPMFGRFLSSSSASSGCSGCWRGFYLFRVEA